MTYLRTKVRDVGDIVTEQTSQEHAGEFSIGTSVGKFTIPLDVSGSNFSRQRITQIVCLENVGYVSGTALVLSSSTISNVSGISGTIAQDINELNASLNLLTASVISISGTTSQDINELSSLITSVSSSFVTTISIFSGSTASDINDLSQLLNTVSSSAAQTTTQFPLASGTIAQDITLINSNLNATNNKVANLTASLNTTNNSIAAITASNTLFSASVVFDFNSVNNKVANLTASLNTSNNNIAALTASVAITSASIPTAAFEMRWSDLQGMLDVSTGVAALTFEPYFTNGMSYYFFANNANDTLSPKFQMPHSWAKTSVRPHLHVIPCADPITSQIVTFGYQVQWLSLTGSFSSTWTTGSVNLTINPGDINKHIKVSLLNFSPLPQPSASDFLLMRIMRSGSSALDTYTTAKPGTGTAVANLLLLGVDVHFQQNIAGTILEF